MRPQQLLISKFSSHQNKSNLPSIKSHNLQNLGYIVHLFFRNLKSSIGKELPKYFKLKDVQDHAEVGHQECGADRMLHGTSRSYHQERGVD
jgi:hypothetical protein